MSHPIAVTAFEAANSRSYVKAAFAAWAAGETTMALPEGAGDRVVPGVSVTRREAFRPDPGWFEAELPRRPASDRAHIAFSSGTTGQPKAILLSHGAFADVVDRINSAMDVDGSIREYLGVPVTFSFGFGRARAVAAAGGQAYLPEHGFDPTEIARMLAAGEINAVSAVPTLWRILLAHKDTISAESARNLRWIEIGSQWMTAEEKHALRSLFPNARILQHYGLTEASRTALLDISQAPYERLDSVGRAAGSIEIEIDDQGRICTRGGHIAEGLVTEAGITPVSDADGWLTSTDMGHLDDGWLYYGGRADELINSGGVKIDPTAFEQAVNATLGQPGAVAAGRMADTLRGEKVLLAYAEPLDRAAITAAAGAVAEKMGLSARGTFDLRQVAEIPLTATGKVRRAELADLPEVAAGTAARPDVGPDLGSDPTPAEDTPGKTAEIQALWASILGTDTVPMDKSFYDLGGDSLSALTAILRMEAIGIDAETARGIFDGKTILDLVGGGAGPTEAPAPKTLRLTDGLNAVHGTRGLLVLWVVFINWLPGLLMRMGDGATALLDQLAPLWRFGTPGFAMVFGIGIGALGLHLYDTNRTLFLKNTRINALIVLGGVLVLGAARLGLAFRLDRLDDRIVLSGLFYSVLTYFALALLAMPLILRLLNMGANRLLTILALAVGSMLIHEALAAWLAQAQPPAFLEFLKLILTAKYGIFRMTGYVMVGVAIGWLFRRHHATPGIISTLALSGLVLAGFGVLALYQAAPVNPRASFSLPDLWHVAIYAGLLLIILSGFSLLNRNGHSALAGISAFATVTGILALPIFIANEIVLVVKAFIDTYAVPELMSLGLLMLLFVGGFGLVYIRLMRFFLRPGDSATSATSLPSD